MFKHSCAEHGWEPHFLGERGRRFSWEVRLACRAGLLPNGRPGGDRSVDRLFSTCCSAHHPAKIEETYLEFSIPRIVISRGKKIAGRWRISRADFPRHRPVSNSSALERILETAGAILKMMDDIGADYLENCADQIELSLWYLGQRKTATLDHHCRIFQCYYMADQVVGFQDGPDIQLGNEDLSACFPRERES